jgi:biotin transport system substrate-specific component
MSQTEVRPAAEARAQAAGRIAPRVVAVVIGAAVVAFAAQVAVPLPFTMVPLTLQPLAVLVVGGLLGAGGGAAALALYLAAGAAGLPVFAGGAAGAIHLIGPTGGYLLAYPVAAAVTGRLSRNADGRTGGAAVARALLTSVAGMAVIHVGGVSQLALLTGSPEAAFRLGFVPFFANDLVKVGLAALVILGLRPRLRSIR